MAEIDLETPGKIQASCDNAKDYTFYVVADKPMYTPKNFQANPNCVAGKDLYWRSSVVLDQDGNAEIDLAPNADAIKHKMKDDATRKAKLVALATSRPGNKDPNAKLAITEPFTLKKLPPSLEITVEDDKKELKAGEKLSLKVEFHAVDAVTVSVSPYGIFDVPRTSLSATEVFEITGIKDGKATVTVSGTSIGGTMLKKTLDLTCNGYKVIIDAIGYIEPDVQVDPGDPK